MNIRPLSGQCLVEILRENLVSSGGLHIPETAKGKDDVGRLLGQYAVVQEVGRWRQKNGKYFFPDISPGDKVIINQYAGKKLHEPGRNFRLVAVADVLAVLNVHGPDPRKIGRLMKSDLGFYD